MMRSVPTPAVGTLLGAYRVEGLLGSGSMGEVFRGVDVGLNRRVAIKILSEKHRDSAELRARFVREGRAVAAVSHPNVVQVFATGTFDERPYIAMEFLDGTDLGSLVEKQGPLDSRTAVRAAFDAASGLEAASKAGLIHRDVKPSNLVRLGDGTVKVTDFGLAKPVDPGSEPALTAMGVVVGTPDYIAPEQARGEPIDERVDIYALGGSLFFMLVGVPPFRTGRPGEDKYLKVVARHLRQPAPSAAERNPSVDQALSQLVQQMMAKRREERPGYPELLAQLTDCAARLDPSGESLGRALGSSVAASISRGSAGRSVASSMPPQIVAAGPGAPTLPVAGLASMPPQSAAWAPGAPGAAPGMPPMAQMPAMPPMAPGPAAGFAPGDAPAYADDEAGLSRLPPPAFPRWAIAVTLASLALFITGLVVYLGREPVAAPAPAVPPSGSVDAAAPPSLPADAGAAEEPQAPPGMIAVKDDSGKLLFWVSAEPVTAEAFRAVYANHKQKADVVEVVSVSYTRARSYAKAVKARLLTGDEWTIATVKKDVLVRDGLSEWVETEGNKRLAKSHQAATARDDAPYPDVTFRLARDP
jgi:serine/threonine protein kinase